MKNKTVFWIIGIIAVVVIVFILFSRKDEKNEKYGNETDKKNDGVNSDSSIKNQLKSEAEIESTLDILGYKSDVTGQIPYLIGLSDGEKSDYKKYVEYIKIKTGSDLTGLSFDNVKERYEEVQEMVNLSDKINKTFGIYGINVDITKSTSDELKELQKIYDDNDKVLREAAISYAKEFYKLFWLDNAFNTTKDKKGTCLDSYRGFNADTLNNLMSLPKEYAKIANDYVKANWENKKFTIEPKEKTFGTHWSGSRDVNLSGKSIVDALQVSSFMLTERDKKTKPQGLAQKLINLYKNEYFL